MFPGAHALVALLQHQLIWVLKRVKNLQPKQQIFAVFQKIDWLK
jgi:hypothetical protein